MSSFKTQEGRGLTCPLSTPLTLPQIKRVILPSYYSLPRPLTSGTRAVEVGSAGGRFDVSPTGGP